MKALSLQFGIPYTHVTATHKSSQNRRENAPLQPKHATHQTGGGHTTTLPAPKPSLNPAAKSRTKKPTPARKRLTPDALRLREDAALEGLGLMANRRYAFRV